MKKVILVVYFGKLPNYFDLFIDSCSRNDDFDFLIFTDQIISSISNNIKVVNMTFAELNLVVSKKIGEDYEVFSPYKLCDYKPAYGKIFEDYIGKYEVWGYCDTDMVLGRISNFISDDEFRGFDKLLRLGHLSFFKNSPKCNRFFLLNSEKAMNFYEVTRLREPCFFDEIMMPRIMNDNGIVTYDNYRLADILPQNLQLTMADHGDTINYDDQKFIYRGSGGMWQVYSKDNMAFEVELLYIHLQKRSMSTSPGLTFAKDVFICSNYFSNDNRTVKLSLRSIFSYRVLYEYKKWKRLNINKFTIKAKVRKALK